MKKLNQKGFGAVEGLLIFVAVSLIAGTGYYVYKQSQNTDKAQSSVEVAKKTEKKKTEQTNNYKEYSNDAVGLSFRYPEDWVLTEDLGNVRGSGMEGAIYVTSPNGFAVHINPNYGGKGGSCIDRPTDTPGNTFNCTTLEILSKEKIAASARLVDAFSDSAVKEVYLVHTKYTNPRTNGKIPAPKYNIYITNNKFEVETKFPLVGAWLNEGTIVQNKKPSYFDSYITSDDINNPKIFDTADAKQADDIFRSVRI